MRIVLGCLIALCAGNAGAAEEPATQDAPAPSYALVLQVKDPVSVVSDLEALEQVPAAPRSIRSWRRGSTR